MTKEFGQIYKKSMVQREFSHEASFITLLSSVSLTIMDLFCGECRARSACTYVQCDLTLHSTPLYHRILSKTPNQWY